MLPQLPSISPTPLFTSQREAGGSRPPAQQLICPPQAPSVHSGRCKDTTHPEFLCFNQFCLFLSEKEWLRGMNRTLCLGLQFSKIKYVSEGKVSFSFGIAVLSRFKPRKTVIPRCLPIVESLHIKLIFFFLEGTDLLFAVQKRLFC